MTDESFKPGDKVKWNSSGGQAVGKVVKKLTSAMDIEGHHVGASKENPQYLVESDTSGKQAAHKPESLTRV